MRKQTIISLAIVLLMLIAAAPAAAAPPENAAGDFTAEVNFTTITLTPVGSNCLLEVGGKLVFSGTLEGEAPGVTRALVFASCPEVGSSPPGTFPDIFKSKLSFSGTVNGLPATADIVYKGKTEVGGNIKALMHLSNGLKGKLKVDAVVAVGGTYAGLIKDN